MAGEIHVFVILLIIFSFFMCFTTSYKKEIFSTKTAYREIYDVDKTVTKNELMTSKFLNKHCVAVNSQVHLRHGARYPGIKDIRKMTVLHQKFKLLVDKKKYPFLFTWENNFPESAEKTLVDEGEEEQFGLGYRFGTRLFKLFEHNISKIKFISSSKERCTDSAMSFFEGITEAVDGEAMDNLKPDINDNILRFHTLCEKYIVEVDNNKTHLQVYKKFKIGPEMFTAIEDIRSRLELEHAPLDAGELKLLYFLCTFEKIIHGKEDWCDMMTDREREVLEYHNDLKQYWKKAYGHPVIGQMACPLVKTMFTRFDKAIANQINNMKQRGDIAAFYFGHTESLAPLYAALGLFNDSTPLLHTNFKEMTDRRFKSSKILPFSANLAMVLYKCDYVDQLHPSIDDYVVKFYVNEQPEKIPVCDDYICSYKDVRDSYSHLVDHCDFEATCKVTKHDEL